MGLHVSPTPQLESKFSVHSTHSGVIATPLHTIVLLLHAVPSADDGLLGTPAVHTSSVHSTLSMGRSPLSSDSVQLLLPSQAGCWQLPAALEQCCT